MNIKISEDANENYLCKIVKITNLRKHSNADRLQIFTLNGNNIITSLDTKLDDIRLFFPFGSAIAKEYLHFNNEFEEKTLNANTELKGYFKSTGQVKATRLRGEPSQGYIVPLNTLSFLLSLEEILELEKMIDVSFDTINDFQLIKKYENKVIKQQGTSNGVKKAKEPKLKQLLVDNQLHFHNNTPHLGDNIRQIDPEDEIYLTDKYHGSSSLIAWVLVKRILTFFERILKKYFKVEISETEYGFIFSSGKPKSGLPKGVIGKYKNPNKDFYKTNIWERAFNDHKNKLLKGMTIYGELVGHGINGEDIQKQYDYGFKGSDYGMFVYRITHTNVDGNVIELNWKQIKAFCKTYGLETVRELYIGKAKDLFPELSVSEHWHENFLAKLQEKYLEGDCTVCKNKVPSEGIVVGKTDNSDGFRVFKLKSFRFCERESKELEAGILDIESAETNAELVE